MRRLRCALLLCALTSSLASGCRKTGGLPGRPDDQGGSRNGASIGPATESVRRAVLRAEADRILADVGAFREAAKELETTTAAYATSGSEEDEARAQQAFRDAMDVFQRLEVMQVGPLAMSSQPGGANLRGEIYIWPLFNPCFADQVLVAQRYEEGGLEAPALSNVRGLDAIEYLLFYDGAENGCPDGSPINAQGQWDAIDAASLAQRRADYAREAAARVRQQADALHDAWDPARGDFHGELAGAGAGSDTYPTTQAALNALSDALFYLDTETKDMKLGAPLGILETADCATPPCPTLTEAPLSRLSKQNIRSNLLGFGEIFSGGGDGLGFADLLLDVGQEGYAADIEGALGEALGALDAIEEPTLEEALVEDFASVETVHGAVRGVTSVLKAEFVTVLDLELPVGAEGDND